MILIVFLIISNIIKIKQGKAVPCMRKNMAEDNTWPGKTTKRNIAIKISLFFIFLNEITFINIKTLWTKSLASQNRN